MNDVKMSPKLASLCKWKHIQEANNRLDQGDSPNAVATFINKNGFKISVPLVYEYAKLRKKALVDGINIEHLVGIASKPLIDNKDPAVKSTKAKLKSEIDALDKIIQGGYNTLIEWADRPISPKIMMDAIKLKNDLTDGNHGFLTNYGMEQLKEIEQKKYQLLMEHLISYIPEDKKQEAVDKISILEDEYYQTTPYYEEYVKALGLSEEEQKKKLDEYYSKQEDIEIEES